MQTVSSAYKQDIQKKLRNHSYMVITIGVINQEAQKNAFVNTVMSPTSYLSDNDIIFGNWDFEAYYASAEENFSSVDGSMYFAPPSGKGKPLQQGTISENVMGSLTIHFGGFSYDLRGLTINFGKNYPVDFVIIDSNGLQYPISGNTLSNFIYDGVIFNTQYVTIVPATMVGGSDRLRILNFTAGIGIVFDNKVIKNSSNKDFVSPLSEELPTIDFTATIDNANRLYDIENDTSTINYFETGQDVKIEYGYELDSGQIEWIKGGNLLLSSWSADDKDLKLAAVDRWTSLNGEYYKGIYYPDGRTLYQLAIDVFTDAGVLPEDYFVDPYLHGITVYNPIPRCTHAEALQLIANAGRCVISQDRDGILTLKHSFPAQRPPDMVATTTAQSAFSTVGNVLSNEAKRHYAISNEDLVTVDSEYRHRPQTESEKLFTGFISGSTSDADGLFTTNPQITVTLEASYVCYALMIQFGGNHPTHQIIRTYLNDELVETHQYTVDTNTWSTDDAFAEFDRMVIEFDVAKPYNRVVVDNITFGDVTDYYLTYSNELTKYPAGEKIERVKEIDQTIYQYSKSFDKTKELYKQIVSISGMTELTVTFSNPSYNFSATVNGTSATIAESGAYYVLIRIPTSVSGSTAEVRVTGNEFTITEQLYVYSINEYGSIAEYANVLISTLDLAHDVAEWEGDYNYSDRVYDNLAYRGDPRIEANDILFLENKYVNNIFIRVYQSEIKFNGALSGTVSARRDATAEGSFVGVITKLNANASVADRAATADHATNADTTANIETPNTGGYTTDQYGNFVHASTTTTNTWNIKSHDGTNKFQVNYESGETNVYGYLTVSGTDLAVLKFATSQYDGAYIRAYDDNQYGQKVLFQSGGSMVIGSGEFAYNLYNGHLDGTDDASGEQLFIGSDSHFNLYSNGNTIANRHRWQFATDGALYLPDTAYPTTTDQPKLTKDGNLYMKTAYVEGWLSTILTGKVDSSLAGSSFASLADFVTATAAAKAQYGWAFNFKDTTGWGPLGTANQWYRCVVQYQNNLGTSSSVAGTIRVYGAALLQQWTGYITGTTADAATVVWRRYIISNSAEQLAAGRAIISGTYGEIGVSPVTSTELGYLDGVTSNIQTQIDNVTPDRTANSSTGLASTSITQNTNTNGGSFTLSQGRYIVTVTARWNANATGSRQVWLATTSTGGAMTYNDVSSIPAASGTITSQQITSLIEVTESTTYYIVLYHTSTAAVTCTTRYSIMKLSNI